MNKNYKAIQAIMEGVDLLYGMVRDLDEGIRHLPGCKTTANLKQLAANTQFASGGVYHIIQQFADDIMPEYEEGAEDMSSYDDTDDDEGIDEDFDEDYGEDYDEDFDENTDTDIPASNDIREFLVAVSELLKSGQPVSITADIYINGLDDEKEDNE